jgi:hypothetical protein
MVGDSIARGVRALRRPFEQFAKVAGEVSTDLAPTICRTHPVGGSCRVVHADKSCNYEQRLASSDTWPFGFQRGVGLRSGQLGLPA